MSLQIGSQGQGGNLSFMQQGQVDWVAFGNTIWTASSAVLQRFAAAGIQPVTYGAGIVLSNQMHLDRVGQSRVEKAVKSLQSSYGFDKLLWFGFGYQSFVGTMAETVAGIKCLGICACLAEAHSEELAAWVLAELWRISGFPEDYEPSHSQLLALVKASAGVVSSSDFSKTINMMLGDQLWRPPSDSYGQFPSNDYDILEASNAKDIANALHGLFKISRGDVDHIVINGGTECAFVAALAHWLLNLKVLVRDSTGHIIYGDIKSATSWQVIVQFGEATSDPLQVARKTYVLGNCREVFGRIPDREDYQLIVRTPWDCCLSRVFGSRFTTLSKMPHVLGDYLGSVARIYRAVANGENNIGSLSRINYVNFAETSFGLGLVETVISTSPELEKIDGLYDRMQHAADLSFDEAVRTVELCINGLEALCECEYCSSEQEDSILRNSHSIMCLVGVAYAIRGISVVMGSLVQDPECPGLLPAVNGMYYFSAFGKDAETPSSKVVNDESNFGLGLETGHRRRGWNRASFYWDSLGLVHDQGISIEFQHRLLGSVCMLFQGSKSRAEGMKVSDRKRCTAVSRRGVCCYIEALAALSCQAERLCKMHVLAGQIHCKNRRYDLVIDENVLGSYVAGIDYLDPAILEEPASPLPGEIMDPGTTKVEALATEQGVQTAISFVYRVTVSRVPIYVSPGLLTKSVLENTGLIACESRGCRDRPAFPCHSVEAGWRVSSGTRDNSPLKYQSGVACCIWKYQDEVARCLVMVLHMKRHGLRGEVDGQFVFLKRNECLPCCTKSVLQASGKLLNSGAADKSGQKKIVVHII